MAAKWEQLLQKSKELRGKSNGLLFDRAKLLVEVWNDGEYLAFHKGDLAKAEDYLDAEVGDYGLCFFDLKAMLESFPKRAQWEKANLRELLAQALEMVAVERKERQADSVPVIRQRVTRKEYEEAVAETARVEKRAELYESEADKLRRRVMELEAENRNLVAENARLEGRISELERMLNRQRVTA